MEIVVVALISIAVVGVFVIFKTVRTYRSHDSVSELLPYLTVNRDNLKLTSNLLDRPSTNTLSNADIAFALKRIK